MTDFHTHILPAVDDGSKSVEASLEMLRMERQQGIDRVVLTPHFYANHDSPERFLHRRDRAIARLRDALQDSPADVELRLGAEVYYFDGMSDCEHLRELAIEGTDLLLVEMPFEKWTARMYRELDGISSKSGLTPVIAHIDRYISRSDYKEIFERLSEFPVYIQANADFFTGFFTKKLALRLLSEKKIHFLGSDCHNTDRRPPNYSSALSIIEKNLGEIALKHLNLQINTVFGPSI